LYRPVLDFALRHRAITLGIAVLTVAGALALVPRIGKEFMPPLNEGDLMFMPVTDPAISLTQAIEIVKTQNAAIGKFPEVASVVAKIARADTSTDPAPVNMTETIVSLKPESAWRPGMTREKLVGETSLTVTIEGRQRFPVRVRYAPEYRANPRALGSVLVAAPNGTPIPLGQLAEIRQVSGPAMISSENGLLVVTVLLNVRGRDV